MSEPTPEAEAERLDDFSSYLSDLLELAQEALDCWHQNQVPNWAWGQTIAKRIEAVKEKSLAVAAALRQKDDENAEKEIQVRDNQITQLLATNDKHVIALENAEREKERLIGDIETLKSTLRHDEESLKNWAKRDSERVDDLIKTARERDDARAALESAEREQRERDAEIVGAYAERICEPWQYLRARELQKAILADAKPEGGEEQRPNHAHPLILTDKHQPCVECGACSCKKCLERRLVAAKPEGEHD